jgi:hypothetical protein
MVTEKKVRGKHKPGEAIEQMKNADRKIFARIREVFGVPEVDDDPLAVGQQIIVEAGDGQRGHKWVGQKGVIEQIGRDGNGKLLLTFQMDDGTRVTSADVWWRRRRVALNDLSGGDADRDRVDGGR